MFSNEHYHNDRFSLQGGDFYIFVYPKTTLIIMSIVGESNNYRNFILLNFDPFNFMLHERIKNDFLLLTGAKLNVFLMTLALSEK